MVAEESSIVDFEIFNFILEFIHFRWIFIDELFYTKFIQQNV